MRLSPSAEQPNHTPSHARLFLHIIKTITSHIALLQLEAHETESKRCTSALASTKLDLENARALLKKR
jgi:hypothetical protein